MNEWTIQPGTLPIQSVLFSYWNKMYVTLQSTHSTPNPSLSVMVRRHHRKLRGIPKGGRTRQRSKAVSWLPLILIIREHDSSIWVSSSQSSRQLARPILLLSLMDVETGEMKIPALRCVLPLDFLLERWIGPEQRPNNVKVFLLIVS